MNKKTIQRYMIFTLGSLIMGIGIGFCNFAELGVDPMSVLVLGTYQRIHVSFGVMNFLICMIQMLITFFLNRKTITLATLIAMAAVSLGIDAFALLSIPSNLALFPYQYAWLILGIVLYCFGIAMSQLPECGYNTYDGVIFGIQKYLHVSYHQIRWGIDLTMLSIGYFLGGTVGIGTLLILLMAGKLIEYDVRFLKKYIKV